MCIRDRLEPPHDYTEAAWQIEYLNMVSKQFGADMTVLFDKNADLSLIHI